MFKYRAIKKYGTKLLPVLEKSYGKQNYYTPSQVRTCVYKNDFSPKYLPLGYLLFTTPKELNNLLALEFPLLDLNKFKQDILTYLGNKKYQGYLQVLNHA